MKLSQLLKKKKLTTNVKKQEVHRCGYYGYDY